MGDVAAAAESGDMPELARALISRAAGALDDPRTPPYARAGLVRLILDLQRERTEVPPGG